MWFFVSEKKKEKKKTLFALSFVIVVSLCERRRKAREGGQERKKARDGEERAFPCTSTSSCSRSSSPPSSFPLLLRLVLPLPLAQSRASMCQQQQGGGGGGEWKGKKKKKKNFFWACFSPHVSSLRVVCRSEVPVCPGGDGREERKPSTRKGSVCLSDVMPRGGQEEERKKERISLPLWTPDILHVGCLSVCFSIYLSVCIPSFSLVFSFFSFFLSFESPDVSSSLLLTVRT